MYKYKCTRCGVTFEDEIILIEELCMECEEIVHP